MNALSTASLDKLSTLGLVNADQRDAILAHPDYAAFVRLAQPEQQLLWAYRQGLISHQSLDALTTLEQSERARIVSMVNDQIADEIRAHHRQLLDQLQMSGLITTAQRHAEAPEDYLWRIDSTADMLFALCQDGVVTAHEILVLRDRVRAEKHPIDVARRLQIVEQVHEGLEADRVAS